MNEPTTPTTADTLAAALRALRAEQSTSAQDAATAQRTAERAASQPLSTEERAEELRRVLAELATTREQADHLAAIVRGHADALLRDQRPDLDHLPV